MARSEGFWKRDSKEKSLCRCTGCLRRDTVIGTHRRSWQGLAYYPTSLGSRCLSTSKRARQRSAERAPFRMGHPTAPGPFTRLAGSPLLHERLGHYPAGPCPRTTRFDRQAGTGSRGHEHAQSKRKTVRLSHYLRRLADKEKSPTSIQCRSYCAI